MNKCKGAISEILHCKQVTQSLVYLDVGFYIIDI